MFLHTIAILLAVGACVLAISTYKYFHHTWDEPEHLAAGMQIIDRGVYGYDVQHPPLARIAIALGPYLAGIRSFGEAGSSGDQEGRDLLYRSGRYEEVLALARLGVLPFLVILLGATWCWARRYFGLHEATLAVFFLATTPPLIGHSALAALDVPGAAMFTLASYALLRWLESRAWYAAAASGLATGLAIATKLSNLPFIAIGAAVWISAALLARRKSTVTACGSERLGARALGQAAGIAALALLVAIFCYGFGLESVRDFENTHSGALGHAYASSGWAGSVPLPMGLERLSASIEALAGHNGEGHLSYLMGRFSQTGFRYFYIVALAVKTPLPLLLLGISGMVLLCWRAHRHGWIAAAPVATFVALLAFCSLYSHINIGLRHVLVLYPLLAIAAAAAVTYFWRSYRHYTAHAALALLLLFQASSMVTAYPDYLAYFNMIAGDRPERILIDSDLDWGQDLKRLRNRLDELRVTEFGFVYRGTADVIEEGLPGVRMMQPFEPGWGWIAASIFARDTVSQGDAFRWLKAYTPVERIGKSIDLYFIPGPKQETSANKLRQ